MKVEDKRHWARGEDDPPAEPAAPGGNEPAEPAEPAELAAWRARAEGAERKLRDLQEAFLAAKTDLDKTRERLERDLERKVDLRFGSLVTELLESADDLDRAIEAGAEAHAGSPLLHGVVLARDRFLAALERAGVKRFDPVGTPYDPNVAEAVGIVPVDDPAAHDTVVQIARPGYKLGDRVVRAARVLVGRLVS
jgi:molecular chaperone GrpE